MIYLSIAVLYLGCSVLTWGWFIGHAHGEGKHMVVGGVYQFALALSLLGPLGLYALCISTRSEWGHWPWRNGWRWK